MSLRLKLFLSFLSFTLVGSILISFSPRPTGITTGELSRWILGGLLLTGGAWLVAHLISRSFMKALERISAAVDRVSSGDFIQHIPVSRWHEMGRLARHIEEMSDRLRMQVNLLERSRQNLETVFDSMSEGVLVANEKGLVTATNPSFRRFFGVTGNPVGKLPLEVIRSPGATEGIEAVLESGEAYETEIRSGQRVFRARFAPLGSETPKGVVAVFSDITEMRRLESLRKEFVSNVSHELKTPLTSIQGFAETLLDEPALGDPHRRFLSRIYENAAQLSTLIEQLFNLARLESPEGPVEWQEVDFRVLVDGIRAEFARDLESKEIEFRLVTSEEKFWAGTVLIRRVLVNLIANAVKYTPRGKITVKREKIEGKWLFSVQDTGIGIPAEDLTRIFERFYRVDKDRSRTTGGSGIGLAIVKHIVHIHGGEVWAESRVNHGTTIYFTLPVQPFETRQKG